MEQLYRECSSFCMIKLLKESGSQCFKIETSEIFFLACAQKNQYRCYFVISSIAFVNVSAFNCMYSVITVSCST